ncbi:MAG: hypothetical protein ACRDD8_15850 [Bacteroidales bacterium]
MNSSSVTSSDLKEQVESLSKLEKVIIELPFKKIELDVSGKSLDSALADVIATKKRELECVEFLESLGYKIYE